jgi:hypothetical protein
MELTEKDPDPGGQKLTDPIDPDTERYFEHTRQAYYEPSSYAVGH